MKSLMETKKKQIKALRQKARKIEKQLHQRYVVPIFEKYQPLLEASKGEEHRNILQEMGKEYWRAVALKQSGTNKIYEEIRALEVEILNIQYQEKKVNSIF